MAKPHVVLDLPLNATWDEVESRYRALAMQHHPDRGGDATAFQRVRAAYSTLKAKQAAIGPFDDIFDDISKEQKT